ncbi:MAG: flavodoxin family protein [Acidimicrobiales bacterium]
MRAVVVYESMFGNTRQIAEAVAEGIGDRLDVEVIRVDLTTDLKARTIDLLVVGAPTHAWGLPRTNTRKGSLEYVRKSRGELKLELGADVLPGVREWMSTLDSLGAFGAAFDTRFRAPAFLTGRAAKAIAAGLERHSLSLVAPPESFIVDRQHHLIVGELERARKWGTYLKNQTLDRSGVDH